MTDVDHAEDRRPPRPAGRVLLIAMLGLILVGAAASVELTVIYHLSNADLSHRSHCSLQGEWDCDDVARSKYAVLLGVPISLWGLVGYGVMAIFAGWGISRRVPWHFPLGILTLLVLVSVGMSAYLAWASVIVLKKKCQYCAVIYSVNGLLTLGLLGMCLWRRVSPLSALAGDIRYLLDRLNVTFVIAGAVLAATAVVFVVGPRLGKAGEKPRPRDAADLVKRPVAPPRRAGDTNGSGETLPPLPRGEPDWVGKLVTAHTPFRGPKEADLYIVEFSDYECPFCQLSNGVMEKILAKYGNRIRLYHRHFPLDTACFKKMRRQMHPHACFAATAAICAHQQGKFWLFHDAQFQLGHGIDKTSIRGLARAVGLEEPKFDSCLTSAQAAKLLQEDIAAGVERNVRGTPTFFMGGPLIDQFQPEGLSVEMFDKLFEALDQAKRDYEARRKGAAPARFSAVPPGGSPAEEPATAMGATPPTAMGAASPAAMGATPPEPRPPSAAMAPRE